MYYRYIQCHPLICLGEAQKRLVVGAPRCATIAVSPGGGQAAQGGAGEFQRPRVEIGGHAGTVRVGQALNIRTPSARRCANRCSSGQR